MSKYGYDESGIGQYEKDFDSQNVWTQEEITDSYFHDILYKLNGEVKILRQYHPKTEKRYIAYLKDGTDNRYISLRIAKKAIEDEANGN